MEELDREQVSDYTLQVVACDMAVMDHLCTRINVTITILDVNDNSPDWLFPAYVEENEESVNVTSDAVSGQLIAQLVAQDRDAGQNGRIRYALHDPHSQVAFVVNATTGQITVADRYSYLSEAAGITPSPTKLSTPPALYPGVYKLKIRASDLGHPPRFSDTWLTVGYNLKSERAKLWLRFIPCRHYAKRKQNDAVCVLGPNSCWFKN